MLGISTFREITREVHVMMVDVNEFWQKKLRVPDFPENQP